MLRKDDEHALAEIRHELGNRFQRLYFWADQGGGEPADGEPADGEDPRATLAGELVSLEAYFRSVLEYFSEPGLNTVEVPVADLVERLRSTVPDAGHSAGLRRGETARMRERGTNV